MNTLFYLLLANATIWIGLGLYIIFIGLEQRNLSRRLDMLEKNSNEY